MFFFLLVWFPIVFRWETGRSENCREGRVELVVFLLIKENRNLNV